MKKLLAAICVLLVIAIVLLAVLLLKKGDPHLSTQTEQTAAGETAAPASDTSTAPAQTGAWKQAYRDYLTDLLPDASTERFALIYIDNDDVPELAVCEGFFHASSWTVLTYRDGGVKEIGDFGSWGSLQYYEKAALICDSFVNQGTWAEKMYRIENGDAVVIWEASGEDGEDENTLSDADGNPVAEEEYDAQTQSLLPADADARERNISYNEGDGWELTSENIAKYLR